MKHYKLRNVQQEDGAFTDLFILGVTRAAGGTSDFTAAATTQSYNLLALNTGDSINYPLAMVLVQTAVNVVTNPKLDVGITGTATQFITGTNNDLATVNKAIVPVAAGAPASPGSGNNLTAAITSTVGNISTITAGEVWIFVQVTRLVDWLTYREA